ncbi:hypothetical protein P280DRAFT_529626 [Massarina eburnea CBS 473.64]|uniref:Uncharacterized protein n=1 Tax=Massarina eburnea CBS 473.64 TaxID=1395130 RepID=A0A6A6RUE0_9PLEO|nr:hypothetical protein P280DRAFT_529626 [Massarina eburnea CBS 473.64]
MDNSPGLLSPDRVNSNESRPFGHIHDDAPSAYERPYDDLNVHHDGDIAMHNMNEPHSGQTISPVYSNRDYSYQPAGGAFESDTKTLLSVAKRYDHRESRKFLFQQGTYRLLITLGFSILIVVSRKAYEGFKNPFIMNKTQVRVFNALLLGLSLGLDLNLASSLKSCAVILRWYFLTRRYVSLEVFDLILGLETLTNVGKLMIISLPGIGPRGPLKFLRRFPWFREGRDDDTRFTWIHSLFFWPIDPSNMSLQAWGNVTVTNLNTWSEEIPSQGRWASSTGMEAAWIHGMEATGYPTTELNDKQVDKLDSPDLSSFAGTRLYRGDGFHQYSVQAKASYKKLATKESEQGDHENGIYIEIKSQKYPLISRTNGSLTFIASTFKFCGPHCTNIAVFQDQGSDHIKVPSLFFCNSELSKIKGTAEEFVNLSPADEKVLYSNDEFARIAAGAIAWTGIKIGDWADRQARYYLGGSKWSPYEVADSKTVKELLARFTIGATAAFDDHGIRYNLNDQPCRPVQGQQLWVDWPYVLGLLGSICSIQLVALICLLAWGNKSVIRDKPFFSLAMLRSPVVDRVGREGMNMSGEELKRHPKLRWKKIKYDYTEGKDGEPNKVDVAFLGRGAYEARRSWAPGIYT